MSVKDKRADWDREDKDLAARAAWGTEKVRARHALIEERRKCPRCEVAVPPDASPGHYICGNEECQARLL
eukprot:4740284-Alexandrium_andersonii.AAC.1